MCFCFSEKLLRRDFGSNMFVRFVMRLHNITRNCRKQVFLPETLAFYSSDDSYRQKNPLQNVRQTFAHRRRPKLYTKDVGIRHTVRIMQETDIKGSRRLMDPELYDIEENEFDEQIQNAGQVYGHMKREKEMKRKQIVSKIIEKKYFKPPIERTLLTYAAKEQVRYLNEMDPMTWTPEKLAESFPISVTGVKKLLKSRMYTLSEERIAKHDKVVRQNWAEIRSGDGGPISLPINPKLLSSGSNHQNTNPSLPRPSLEWKTNKMAENSQVARQSPPGEFENLIQTKRKQEKENIPMPIDVGIAQLSNKSKSLAKNRSITIDELKQNLSQSVSSGGNPDIRRKWDQWVAKTRSSLNEVTATNDDMPPSSAADDILAVFEGKVKKYRDVATPDLKWDVRKGISDENRKEAYIYDAKLGGYQRPYGSYHNKESLKIPSDQPSKPGTIYRKNDSYYDENGEFLYRVPFFKE